MSLNTLILTIIAMIAFAANSVLTRLGLLDGSIDALSFTHIRLVSAAMFLGLLVYFKTSEKESISWDLISIISLFGYALAFSLAYLFLPTGLGALILFSAVQFTMLGYGVISGERPSTIQWLGITVALVGFIALLLPGASAPPSLEAALMCLSGICWGVYSLRGRHSSLDPIKRTAYNFIGTLPLVLLVLSVTFFVGPTPQLSSNGVWLAIMSGAVTSGGGYAIWYIALRGLTATQGGVVQLSVPVLAAVGGGIFAAEIPSIRFSLIAMVILLGVALALWPNQQVRQ
ncbi:DMT family transporter [uncultured Paraglaciecola sp.]|uniref:DMT family transporter n=1 Tax=uncultured Paraglaciecola sp. TaxID=1765024 RepID=UPI0030D8C3B2|tara:strand:+ start:124233 stop:125093 length:861 start_codon:yes stop_codon:yes gene_type:complete